MERYNHRKTNRGTLRQERNQLLKDCDFRVLVDYPHNNKEAWVLYRQELRDFLYRQFGQKEHPFQVLLNKNITII